jgi:hypothetical protein
MVGATVVGAAVVVEASVKGATVVVVGSATVSADWSSPQAEAIRVQAKRVETSRHIPRP